MKLKILAVLIALLVAWPVAAYGLNNDKFGLWHDCQPVDLVVDGVIQKPLDDSIKDRIRTAIESRLRAARIYTGYYYDSNSDDGYKGSNRSVYFTLINTGSSFTIRTELVMLVYRPEIDEYGVGILWRIIAGGTFGGSGGAGFILQSVTELTDEFINEYLRVNADACN